GTEGERNTVAQIDTSGYQSLLPPITEGGATSFDPGDAEFGLFYYSQNFGRHGFTEDRLNSPASAAHRARIYPAQDRSGTPMANSYIVAFEDASNGDYQDYVFLVTGLRPVGAEPEPTGDAVRVNFSDATAALPTGYLRDHGQPFGPRTGSDQGEGLSYGWLEQGTDAPIDLSVGGSTPGNGRDRNTSQPDQRLDTLMHMQSEDLVVDGGTFNGTAAYGYWEIALADGDYRVTVAAGDPTVNSDPESHAINLEGEQAVAPFEPTGTVGADTRHEVVTTDVTVTDGALTVDAEGGTNTKINYIDIVPLTDDGGPDDGDNPSDGADVKVNFQTAAAPTPSGWTADTGLAYDADRGFGWLDADTNQPVDRATSMRYRTAPTPGITYPDGDVTQQTFSLMQNDAVTDITNGTWEYDLDNGTYEVAVAVGEPGYLDSTHGVAAEGQPVITGFVPTGTAPFQTGVQDVEVTDGKLTITANGENTKIAWVSITGENVDPVDPVDPPTGGAVQVNFGPTTAPSPEGWTREPGVAFSEGRGFGWLDADTGQPVDRQVATRHRTTPEAGIAFPSDEKLTTFAFLDNDTQDYTNGTWELALPNGQYQVELAVGDANYTDSTHGVAVEGVGVIDGYQPTGAEPFGTGSAAVTVQDGRLTMTNTGTNTKVNWIRVTGENLNQPAVDLTAGDVALGSSYIGGPVDVEVTATPAGDATIESLTYTVNGGEAQDYTGPISLETEGTYVLEVTAVDSEDRTTVREVTLEIMDVGGTVELYNQQVTRQDGEPIPGMSEDWVALHRINSNTNAHQVIDEAVVDLSNTGEKDLYVGQLELTGPNASAFTLTGVPEAPFTLAPGESQPITVEFTTTSGNKGIRSAQISMTTSDPENPTPVIQVRGAYMTSPEGGNEISLNQVSALYGWTQDIGNLSNGDEMRDTPLNGDEVRSFQWTRADDSKPVTVRQLAAFHGCCGQTETVNIAGSTATHHGDYGQSILPLNNALSGPTQLTANPNGNFGIVVSGQSTNNSNYMAVKTWPVIDRDGEP
ncbi:hypothetical protein PU560_07595, partial [Georgenia sp. 10Sc9-8]|nr:hypothetical protein [Georgenia halotolerans]